MNIFGGMEIFVYIYCVSLLNWTIPEFISPVKGS